MTDLARSREGGPRESRTDRITVYLRAQSIWRRCGQRTLSMLEHGAMLPYLCGADNEPGHAGLGSGVRQSTQAALR